MAKPIKFKEFQKSRSRMTRQQYEKECGAEISAPEVYSYVCFFHIEVHKDDKGIEWYVVNASTTFDTGCLKSAEKFLYKEMKNILWNLKEFIKKNCNDKTN